MLGFVEFLSSSDEEENETEENDWTKLNQSKGTVINHWESGPLS